MTKTDNNITVKGAGIIAENKEERGRLEVSANAESSISVISTCSTDSDDNRPKSGLAALEPRFLAELKRLEPNYKDMSFIIAFSGGRDSLALAHLMKRAIVPENLTLLHLDHKIREESLKDAHECLNLAEGLGLRFVLKTKDVLELAKERGKGVEEAGRAARYEALEEERRQRNANYIVTAHHADDLSETMLFNLIRGAGPGGFKGIASKSHNIIRPLLPILRDEITKALTEEKLSWIEDASNLSHKHKRNFLRLEVLPLLIELNPKLKEAFWRLSIITDAEEDFWDKTLDGLMSSLVHQKGPNRFEIERKGFLELHLALKRRLLGRIIRLIDVPGRAGGEPPGLASVNMALDFIQREQILSRHKGKGLDLPSGRRVELTSYFISLGPASRFEGK